MNRTLLAACVCAFLAWPLSASGLRAQDAPPAAEPAQVTVVTKDGRRLEGLLLSEDANGVVIRMKLGAEVPIAKADIQEIVRAAAGAGGGEEGEDALPGETVETHTIFTLKDSRVVRGRATDKGTYWEVENDLGTIRVEKASIASSRTEQVRRGAAVAPPEERDEARDLGLGLSLTRPGPEWRFEAQPPDPLARIVMRRSGPVAIFRIALAEALPPELREPDPASRGKVQEIVTKELKEKWRGVRAPTIDIVRFHGVSTWRATYQADARVFGSKYVFQELYLPYRDGRIVLQGYAPLDQEKAALPEIAKAFEGFSFLGTRTEAAGEVLDYSLGIRIPRPRSDWRPILRLFDPETPMELLPPDGVGRYRLEVAPASGASSTPGAAADLLEKMLSLKSRGFRRVGRAEKNLSGVPAVDLRYQDLEGKTLMDVRRLILVRDQKVIQFVASTPAPDPSAKAGTPNPFADRAAQAEALVDAIDALAEESPLAAQKRGQRAADLATQGARKLEEAKEAQAAIALLTQALDLAPTFAQAYLIRGKAFADTGDYKRAMKDYELAGDISDDPALGKLIATAQSEQAKRIAREDFPEARKLYLAAIRNDPSGRTYKEDLTRTWLDHARGLATAGKFDAAIDELKEALRRFPEESRYQREHIRVHLDWARKYQNDGELYKARQVFKRAQKLDPENTSIKSMLDRIEQDIKRKEDGDPKKGKKK